MSQYRIRAEAARTHDGALVDWLEAGRSYHGIVRLSLFDEPRVRLYHPRGGGCVDLPVECVRPCRTDG